MFRVSESHNRGLSVGLKNALDLISALEPSFDWALNEQCLEYNECGQYQIFLDHSKVCPRGLVTDSLVLSVNAIKILL